MTKKIFSCPICDANFVAEVDDEETTATCECGQTATAVSDNPETITP